MKRWLLVGSCISTLQLSGHPRLSSAAFVLGIDGFLLGAIPDVKGCSSRRITTGTCKATQNTVITNWKLIIGA